MRDGTSRGRRPRAMVAAATVVLVGIGASGVRAAAPATSSGAAAARQSRSTAGWPMAGQNYDNARAAVGSRITSANVDRLQEAFAADVPGAATFSTAAVVVDGTVYVQGGSGVVVAIDADTGTKRWTSAASSFNVGPFGVAVADGRVMADAGSNGVLALDQNTGKELWRTKLATTATLGVDIQPTVFDGLVFASTVPVSVDGIFTPGDRGVLYALDAATGVVRWSFDTVKGGDLWGHPEVNSGGGAWYTPAVDPARRVVYFGTANPAPFVGTAEYPNGTSRPGANLYSDSILALDVDTGALRWYHQVTAHDLYDRDQVHALIVRPRKGRAIVVSAGKSGVVVGLDPVTGRVLWQRAVGVHRHDTDRSLTAPTDVWPGTYGGILTPPAAADGVVYVATVNAPSTLPPDKPSYFGGQLGTHEGEVVAIGARTGKVVWDTKVPGDPLGGATVVNDLVLTALLDGTVVALDRGTGAIVWKYQARGTINGWLAAVGDTLYIPVGGAKPPQLLALRLPSKAG